MLIALYFTAAVCCHLGTYCQMMKFQDLHDRIRHDKKDRNKISRSNATFIASIELLHPKTIRDSWDENTVFAYQKEWPRKENKFGAVSAVSLDTDSNVVIFHRADRMWTEKSFNNQNVFLERNLGTIKDVTIVALDRVSGKVAYECGKNLFYMPHGLSVDPDNNVWVTDVALHQVMKFSPQCISNEPILVLGTAFEPGIGKKFCKPTAVAVLPTGDFFVADGYCNSRILKLSKNGDIILIWGAHTFQGDAYKIAPPSFFAVPHGLTLANQGELLCVADRENGRVQCFQTSDGSFYRQYHNNVIGDRIFGVAYAPIADGQLFIVNGPEYRPHHKVQGFVIDMKSKQVVSKWGPDNLQFSNPHDVAILRDGSEVFVAELDPPRVHKFITTFRIGNDQQKYHQNVTFNDLSPKPFKLAKPIALTVLSLVLIGALLVTAFLVAMSVKKKGNVEQNINVEYSKLMSRNACRDC